MRTVLAALHTAFVGIVILVITPVLVGLVFVGRLFRIPDRPAGLYDRVPGWWSHLILTVAGVRLRVHGQQNAGTVEPRVFVCNHLSWFDVFAMAAALGRGKFVAKAELFKIPVFGPGMRAAGMVRIERENRKSAFGAYELAAQRIRDGASVVVYPEGTRGLSYELRPFKKGPFVLAIAAGVPIVPVVMHGQMEVMRKGDWRMHPGTIRLHYLEPIPTSGYTYDRRDELMLLVHRRMERALYELYGVGDPPPADPAADAAPAAVVSELPGAVRAAG